MQSLFFAQSIRINRILALICLQLCLRFAQLGLHADKHGNNYLLLYL